MEEDKQRYVEKSEAPEEQAEEDTQEADTLSTMPSLKEPIDRLKGLQEEIQKQTASLKSDGAQLHYESGDMKQLQDNVREARALFEDLKAYCKEYADTSHSVGATFGDLSKDLSEIVKGDFKPFDESEEEKTVEELDAEARVSEAQAQVAALAVSMHELQQLSVAVEESASRAAGAAAKAASRADGVDGRAEDARSQAEVKEEKNQEEEKEQERLKMEEEKKKKEEDGKKKKEEERLKQIEEKKQQELQKKQDEEKRKQEREDPKHWPSHIYGSSDGASDYIGHCISCVFRTRGNSFKRESVQCCTLEALTAGLQVGDHEEVIGNIVHIKPQAGAKLDGAVWLALPIVGTRVGQTKELIVRQRDSKGAWHNLFARETSIADQADTKFIETPLRTLEEMTLAPMTRLKCDNVKVGVKGGKMSSTADPRVTMHVPKGGFSRQTEIQLQVQHMDSSSLQDLKLRHEVCAPLLGVSPMLMWKFQSSPDKSIKITMPGPSGGARKRPKTSMTGGRGQTPTSSRPSTAWGGKPHRDDGAAVNDKVHALVKTAGGNWQLRPDLKLMHTRDLLSMEVKDVGKSFVLLRIQGEQEASTLSAIASKVESTFDDRPVCVVLRQKSADESQVYIELAKSGAMDRKLTALKERGFDCGVNPSREFYLNEGDQMEMRFRGNIDFDDRSVRQFMFYSSIPSVKIEATVSELDKFAQHGLEFFRGYVQIWLKRRNVPKVMKRHVSVIQKEEEEKPVDDFDMVTEMPVTLPKPNTEQTTVSRAPVKFRSQGPLTMEYFDELKTFLGDEWKGLGEELGVSNARIQSIVSNNAYGGDKLRFILEMILTWFKGSTAAENKVSELFWGLRNIGREDLAQELYRKNQEFQDESERRYEEEKMRLAFKAVTDSTTALLQWKKLAQVLGVSTDGINEIDSAEADPLREKATAGLLLWREQYGRKATRQKLIRVLRKINLVEAAENVCRLR